MNEGEMNDGAALSNVGIVGLFILACSVFLVVASCYISSIVS